MSDIDMILPPTVANQLAGLYAEMEQAYAEVAARLDFSCRGCADNCCDSYFFHHTYVEWAYLWAGLNGLPAVRQKKFRQRAEEVVRKSEKALARGDRPQLMCPLNEDGLCALYSHRLMICRLHGVAATLTRPDGQCLQFPGCHRCQELTAGRPETPSLDRTALYRRLAELELFWLGPKRPTLPKVKLTLAQMLVKGPPEISE